MVLHETWKFEYEFLKIWVRHSLELVRLYLEHLEHGSRRIRGRFTLIWCWKCNTKIQYLEFFETTVRVILNLIAPLDRARWVVLGTRMKHLEIVLRRIHGKNTRIWWRLYLSLKRSIAHVILPVNLFSIRLFVSVRGISPSAPISLSDDPPV